MVLVNVPGKHMNNPPSTILAVEVPFAHSLELRDIGFWTIDWKILSFKASLISYLTAFMLK